MGDLDVDREPIYVFRLDDAYVFRHYFELTDCFDALAEFYDDEAYRFEVPDREWDDVVGTLREFYYDPEVVEDVEPFVVVKEAYTPHAEILRNSVANWTRRGYNFFLMTDPLAVERAVQEEGATPVAETDLVVGL